jgi:hypothetical protein
LQQTVPIIYSPAVQRLTVPLGGRIVAMVVAAAALSLLVIATVIKPSPKGIGTHLSIGFEPCQFERISKLPCPTCGMTTSFAWFVRGNWMASFYVQPMGFVLALVDGTIFWASLYIALTGRPIQRLMNQLPGMTLTLAAMGLGIAAWGWKILIYLRGIDGWGS